MKAKYFALGALLLGSLAFVSCKSDKKSGEYADTISQTAEAADEEYPAAPTLSEKQIAVSDSVFNAYKAKNKVASDSVITTASGLRYIVLKEGTGKSPVASDNVKVHYVGTLPDGRVFDSSVERGEPITFPLGGVISGWTEGLQLMKEGGKTLFYIPSNLAYGSRDMGDLIGPNQDLVFEVELIQVNPQD